MSLLLNSKTNKGITTLPLGDIKNKDITAPNQNSITNKNPTTPPSITNELPFVTLYEI